MNYSTKKRPFRPVAQYKPCTVRYRRWEGTKTNMDIRCYRPPKGWSARADMWDYHPITHETFVDSNGEPDSEWWITEIKDDPYDDM